MLRNVGPADVALFQPISSVPKAPGCRRTTIRYLTGTVLAMRTSPTNIGLWLLSALGAHDFGYLTGDEVIERAASSLETLKRLERYNGHLLNWYDLRTLTPLEPRYVSTVDSGNLLACLWTFDAGIQEILTNPSWARALTGSSIRFDVLRESLEKSNRINEYRQIIEVLERGFSRSSRMPWRVDRSNPRGVGPAGMLGRPCGENAVAGERRDVLVSTD